MSVRNFAIVYAIVFLLVGILGFIPGPWNGAPPIGHDLHVTNPAITCCSGCFM